MIRIPILAAAILIVAIPTIIWAGDLVIPHVFVPDTTIRAAEVNANFEALRSGVAAVDGMVVNGGGVVIDSWTDSAGSWARYVTPLSHPLLDNNPDAIVVAGRRFKTWTQSSQPWCEVDEFNDLSTYYEGGRWWLSDTCPHLKYSVLILSGPRAISQP